MADTSGMHRHHISHMIPLSKQYDVLLLTIGLRVFAANCRHHSHQVFGWHTSVCPSEVYWSVRLTCSAIEKALEPTPHLLVIEIYIFLSCSGRRKHDHLRRELAANTFPLLPTSSSRGEGGGEWKTKHTFLLFACLEGGGS